MNRKKQRPPDFLSRLFKMTVNMNDEDSIAGDFEEEYQQIVQVKGVVYATLWYLVHILRSVPYTFKESCYGSFSMFRNYLKIALRNIRKYKGFSAINILGLALGLASCIFILLYVQFEHSYDNYHKDAERTYRVRIQLRSEFFNADYPMVSFRIAPAYRESFPEIEEVARLYRRSNRLISYKENSFYESGFFYADQEIFDVLTIPLIIGDPKTVLAEPNSIILTEEMANKYFKTEDPIGKTIIVNSTDFIISGIISDPPPNTHLKYKFIASMTTLVNWDEMNNWFGTTSLTYVKLTPKTDPVIFEDKIKHIEERYPEAASKHNIECSYFLQPISDIHLHSHLEFETDPPGNPVFLSIYTAFGILILLIACANYMNLSTSKSIKRAKEVGLRKVIGADRKQLIYQFLGESFLLTVLSIFIAFLIVGLSLSALNNLVGTEFLLTDIFKIDILLILLIIFICTGLIAGSYPAFFLSGFKSSSTIKGMLSNNSKDSTTRKILVVSQFAISIILIILTITGFRQLEFMRNEDLGFNKDQKLIIRVRSGASIRQNFRNVKLEFLKHSNVLGTAVSSAVPGTGLDGWATTVIGEENRNQWMMGLKADPEFLSEYNIQLLAGRFFREEDYNEEFARFLINEAGVKTLGWSSPQEALGKKLERGYGRSGEIIGVIKDFHYFGLQTEIPAFTVDYCTHGLHLITLSIKSTGIKETIDFAEEKWKKLYPGIPFDYFFLDDSFELQYEKEDMLCSLFSVFSFLGIFIAGLGLLGLAAYTAEQRTKEIGIRKVLGSSSIGVITLLTKDFIRLVMIAIIISLPIAYICGNWWLQNFAYRINLDWFPFMVASTMVLLFSGIIVIYQAVNAATANPVESLRYE